MTTDPTTQQRSALRSTRFRGRRGFTLAEVLIALGIFAIGMIAVASLFPVGALLQKETADDILGKQAATNARATMEAVGLTYIQGDQDTDLGMYHPDTVAPHTNVVLPVGVGPAPIVVTNSFFNRYPLADRSYPTTEFNEIAPARTPVAWPTFYETRDHYWFFFVRDTAGNPAAPSWQGFILIAERDGNPQTEENYADVVNGITFGTPTEQGTPYITIDGKTGTWDITSPPTFVGTGVYFHVNGVAVETFTFQSKLP